MGVSRGETSFGGGVSAWTVTEMRQSRVRAMAKMDFIRVAPGWDVMRTVGCPHITRHNELRSMRLAISRMHGPCVELFRLVDWVQLCGINQGHSAGSLSLPGGEGAMQSNE